MYSFDTRIRFSETDADGKLKFTGLLNYFQDCSTFQSEDLGLGVSYLRNKGKVWVVNYWQIDVIKYPRLCDRVTVGTFPYEFKGFLGSRNFFMTDENGEYLAKAASIWTLLSTENGKPIRPEAEQLEKYGVEERLEMDYLPRKIKLPENMMKMEDVVIKQHHLDTNNHVNNGQYVQICAECLSTYTGNPIEVTRVRVEYKKQIFLNEILTPYIAKNNDGDYVVSLMKGDECACVVNFY